MSKAIEIRSLGKKYQLNASGSYLSLRDVVMSKLTRSENVSRDAFWALDDINLDVAQGERIGIIGRNGAGKSTLLKILSRITPPSKGQAVIHGRVASLLEVGTGFHPELTGRENIYFNGSILGLRKKEIDRKLDEIIDFSGVSKFIDTTLKHFSSGMQLRLAFAVAAHLEPEILLIDEVLAVGDMEFQQKCLGKMQEVSRSDGRTILFVSHNMSYITSLCNKAVLLDHGRISSVGAVGVVVSDYMNKVRDSGRLLGDSSSSDIVRLTSVSMKSANGSPRESFGADEEVLIEMEYEVLQAGHVLWLGYNIHNESGVNVFDTHSVGSDLYEEAHTPGRYKAQAVIPAHLLNTGNYFVSAAVFNHLNGIIHLHEKDVTLFHIHDVFDGVTARGMSPGDFPGIVRPLLKWDIKKIGS